MTSQRRRDRLRLGIDLDGVVADFNAGWIDIHRREFGSDLDPAMVTTWDGLAELGGFADMSAFWRWARGSDERPSIFRHLDPYPDALPTLQRLHRERHRIVIITTKPEWAVHDTFRWLADHQIPTREVHITHDKESVDSDDYHDDSPSVLARLSSARGDRVVCRFVRPWNAPLPGVVDVTGWTDFHDVVTDGSRSGTGSNAPSSRRH